MIDNFEKETHELTDYESEKLLPAVVLMLRNRIGRTMAVTNKELERTLRQNGMAASGPRLRKVIHEIRIKGLVERLVATSAGYYVSESDNELLTYVNSLHQRAESILEIARQLEYQRKKYLGLPMKAERSGEPDLNYPHKQASLFDEFGR